MSSWRFIERGEWLGSYPWFPLDPPDGAWILGPRLPLSTDCVVFAGSRSATQYGLAVTHEMAGEAAGAGRVVVSGLAYGIDGAAHRGALAVEGRTMAVLPCGIDKIYPAAHHGLARAILDGGGWIVSEYGPGVTPMRERFLRRNKVMASIGTHVVIVEASLRSGSMHMARSAREFTCRLGAVPGPVTSIQSEGTNDLIAQGEADLVTPSNLSEFLTRS